MPISTWGLASEWIATVAACLCVAFNSPCPDLSWAVLSFPDGSSPPFPFSSWLRKRIHGTCHSKVVCQAQNYCTDKAISTCTRYTSLTASMWPPGKFGNQSSQRHPLGHTHITRLSDQIIDPTGCQPCLLFCFSRRSTYTLLGGTIRLQLPPPLPRWSPERSSSHFKKSP